MSERVDIVVVLELHHWEEVILVVLSFVYKDIEVLVQLLVDMFCLSIYLRVPSSKGGQPDSKKPIEFPSEKCNELQISI